MARTVQPKASQAAEVTTIPSDGSDNDFGNYNVSEPIPSTSRTTKAASKPSTRAASASSRAGRGKRNKPVAQDEVIPIDDSSQDEEEAVNIVVDPPSPKQRSQRGRAAAGKVKDKAPNVAVSRNNEVEDIEMETEQGSGEDVAGRGSKNSAAAGRRPDRTKRKNQSSPPPRKGARTEEHWKAEIQRLTDALHTQAKQFEELSKLRTNNAETVYEVYRKAAEERYQAQEAIITDLTGQIARMDELTKAGKTASIHFLTRESADARVAKADANLKTKESEVARLKKEKDELLKTIKTLEGDLAAEVEHSRKLGSKNGYSVSPSHSRAKVGPKDSSSAPVIRLYEDLTNLLVIRTKKERSDTGGEADVFTCLLSVGLRSLNFDLKLLKDVDQGELVIYTPRLLENEQPEVVEQLDFLQTTFTFAKDQMHVFMKTVTEKLAGGITTEEQEVEEVDEEVL